MMTIINQFIRPNRSRDKVNISSSLMIDYLTIHFIHHHL